MPKVFEVERNHNPTREDFKRNYLAPQKPVVTTGGTSHWRAMARWSDDYLRKTCGHRAVTVQQSQNSHYYSNRSVLSKPLEMNFGDYVDATIGQEKATNYYLKRVLIRDRLPELLPNIDYPIYIEQEIFELPNFWYGPGKNTTVLHYDLQHNFLVQIRGRKRIQLFPPGQRSLLYPSPFYWQTDFTTSQIVITNPDYRRFPKFREAKGVDVYLVREFLVDTTGKTVPRLSDHLLSKLDMFPACQTQRVDVRLTSNIESDERGFNHGYLQTRRRTVKRGHSYCLWEKAIEVYSLNL